MASDVGLHSDAATKRCRNLGKPSRPRVAALTFVIALSGCVQQTSNANKCQPGQPNAPLPSTGNLADDKYQQRSLELEDCITKESIALAGSPDSADVVARAVVEACAVQV